MFPDGDGVPYYVLRELAFMRRASHPCLARLELVNLHNDHLSTFFECVALRRAYARAFAGVSKQLLHTSLCVRSRTNT